MNFTSYLCGKWIYPVVWFVLLVTGGCYHQPTLSEKSYDTDERSAIEYYHWLKSSPGIVLEREREYLEQQPKVLDPVLLKARLALALTLPVDTSTKNEKHALDLLRQVIEETNTSTEPGHRDYRQFSLLWQDVILQRQKLRQSLKKANQKMVTEKEKIQTLNNENAELLKQIEALKSIEQQINKREQKRDKSQ